jgi:hypothetical protein
VKYRKRRKKLAKSNSQLTKIQAVLLELDAATAQAAKLLAPVAQKLNKLLTPLELEGLLGGAASDLMYSMRQAARTPATALAAFEDVFKPFDKRLEEHFINTLDAGTTGVQGVASRVQVTTKSVPVVNDWPALYAHIAKKKEFDLLNKALSAAGVKERWDAGKQVPGVGPFIKKSVSCTKLGGK